MDRELRAFLAAILSTPDDRAPRLVFADWLEERGDPRARKVRFNCETGKIHLRSYSVHGGDSAEDVPSLALLVAQFVPQSLGIEFGCRCAMRVLPRYRDEWPGDDRADRLVMGIRDWREA